MTTGAAHTTTGDGGGPTSRREEKRRQTHQRIYEQAIRLFVEHGYEHVTVNRIAEAAGVSVPTFYAHYASKEDLLLALPSPDQVEGLLARQPAHLSVAEQVSRGILVWLRQYGNEARDHVLERWRIVAATPSLRIRAAEFERKTATMVLDALRARADVGAAAARAEVTVTALLAAYTQILLRWAEGDGRARLEDVAEQVLDELRRL